VTNGRVETIADTTKAGVGSLDGFRPHELLETAVAACMGITARLKADELGVGPVEISTEVSLDRSDAARPVFRGRVTVRGARSDAERATLEDAAFRCAVSQTLGHACMLTRTDGPCDGDVSTVPVGPRGGWNAADYNANASAQSAWGREVHAHLALRPGETVFDLGCGDGRLTAELADRVPSGRVVGLDADADMIRFARRTYGRSNLAFVQGDLRTFALRGRAGLIVSTACLHWVADHEAVLRRCRAHLDLGGRISFQMGGRGNAEEILSVAAQVAAADSRWSAHLDPFPRPWSFYGPEDYETWLPRTGFRLGRAELCPKDMIHDAAEALSGWIRTTWLPILAKLPERDRSAFIDAVVGRYLGAHPPDERGRTHVAMTRLEIEAEAV
jgi:trans-aconitate methyltransferase/uncharacterized OsmC-like protein